LGFFAGAHGAAPRGDQATGGELEPKGLAPLQGTIQAAMAQSDD